MKCAVCGYIFDEKKSVPSCKACPMSKGCRMIRCPNCGYETPPEDGWLKNILKGKKR